MRPLQSASIGNKKSTEISADRPATSDCGLGVSRTRRLGAGWRSRPSVTLHVCVSTGAPRCRRPSHCPPFCVPIRPRRRPIVQWHLTGVGGDFPAHRPGADRPLCFPGRAPLVAPSLGRFATFWAHHRPLCRSIDGASAGNSIGGRPAIAPHLCAPVGDPTLVTPVKGEIKSLDRDPEIATRPRNAISRELISL